MLILIILFTISSICNRNSTSYYIALIDTDSELQSNKINCTPNELTNQYNHADEIMNIINKSNIIHFVVQDSNGIIKQEYIKCALFKIMENSEIFEIVAMPLNSKKEDEEILKILQFMANELNLKIIIGQHPLAIQTNLNQSTKNIIVKSGKQPSLQVAYYIKFY